ncbi:MAG: DUF255 domain-containing protein, partial [Acidianus infernus]|nr:DUF255 domain-containing protein [Acidianus infernus]
MKFEDVIKSLYLQSKLIKLEEKEYVIKCYSTSAGIKWYFISSFFKSYPYASSTRERMNREIDFFTRKWDGIGTPKIIDMDYDTNCIMRDYIKGRPIETEEDFLMLGKAFKIIHEIANIINENFIAIKVDRDEMPEVDRKLQLIVSEISGESGWPLTVFMTPEGN